MQKYRLYSSRSFAQNAILTDVPIERLYRFSSYRRFNGTSVQLLEKLLVRFTSKERLNGIIRDRQEKNVFIANPHSYFIEGWRTIAPEHLKFK